MRFERLCILLIPLCLFAGCAERQASMESPEASRTSHQSKVAAPESLEGAWRGYQVDGPAGVWRVEFTGERFVGSMPEYDVRLEGAWSHNASASPRTIDFKIEKSTIPEAVATRAVGIYKIEEGRLTLSVSEPGQSYRPIDFQPGYGVRVYRMTRE